jgi:hypothetical protein
MIKYPSIHVSERSLGASPGTASKVVFVERPPQNLITSESGSTSSLLWVYLEVSQLSKSPASLIDNFQACLVL